MMYNCKECGKVFEPFIVSGHVSYCSDGCRKAARSRFNATNRKKRAERMKTDKWLLGHDVFHKYKRSARVRGYEFTLSMDYFIEHINSDCHYCGGVISKVGFDRIDNRRGYTEDNVVPCCSVCNLMKRSHGYEEFIERAKMIAKRHGA